MRVVPKQERIENLARGIVAEEMSAIVAWAVAGLPRLMNAGYTEPLCHEIRLAQTRRMNNSVEAFLQDSGDVRRAEGGLTNCRDLFDRYAFYIRDARGTAVSLDRFRAMLEDLDLTVEVRRDLTGTMLWMVHGVEEVSRSLRGSR